MGLGYLNFVQKIPGRDSIFGVFRPPYPASIVQLIKLKISRKAMVYKGFARKKIPWYISHSNGEF